MPRRRSPDLPSLSMLPPELAILGIVLLLCLVIGVPLIRSGIWLPRELEFQTLSDQELEPIQLAHYQRLDVALQPAAYLPRFNFRVTNMQGPTLTRVYLADHEHAVLGAPCCADTTPRIRSAPRPTPISSG